MALPSLKHLHLRRHEWLEKLSPFSVQIHPALHGVDWFMGGVDLLKRAPGWTILGGFLIGAGTVLMSIVPAVGSFAVQIVAPVFVVGIARFFSTIEKTPRENLSSSVLREFFVGFQGPFEKLLLVGVIQLLGSLAIALLTLLPALLLIFFTVSDSPGTAMDLTNAADPSQGLSIELERILIQTFSSGQFWILFVSILAFLFLYIPLSLATWFAPQLIFFHKLETQDALRASLKGCLSNLGAMGSYGAVWLLVGGMATLPLGLGWIICLPILMGSGWISYRDIFKDTLPSSEGKIHAS